MRHLIFCTLLVFSSPSFASLDCMVGDLLADPVFGNHDKFWKDVNNLSQKNLLNDRTLNNLKTKHSPNAARGLPNFSGKSEKQVIATLKEKKFSHHGKTNGGYDQWRHEDGSLIWIRPDGEVVRMSKEMKNDKNKPFRSRYGVDGELTENHNTGEKIVRD